MKNKARIKFSIPFNGDLDLIRWALDSGQVYEVYFSGPKLLDFADPYEDGNDIKLENILSLIKLCNKNSIETNLLVNKGMYFFDNPDKVKHLIDSLRSKKGIINTITIADVYLADFLSKEFPDIKLQSSVYMGLDSVGKVREAIKMRIKSFCLDPNINRDYGELKKISSLKKKFPEIKIKILGLIQCYSNCFFSSKHFELPVLCDILNNNKDRFGKALGLKINPYRCTYASDNLADEVRRSIVRPEDIAYYEKNNLVDYIKIAFRNDDSKFLKEKYLAYFNRKFDGNLFKFIGLNKYDDLYFDNKSFPKGFIDFVMKCEKNCDDCDYCAKIAKRTIFKNKRKK